MPRRDGTGPMGMGAGRGHGAGGCDGRAPDDFSTILVRFIIANWRPILGFLLTTLLPLISKKILALRDDGNKPGRLLTHGDDHSRS